MTTAIYRSPDLADRIEALMSSLPEGLNADDRVFTFQKIDAPESTNLRR